ncbi:biotin-dependent carboxyltransferase family protein [Tropicimonas sp. IMCC34043]|uniref:5-oxoprolinase subunit C family protein n=1 Tax=Tropicimonas sp. IMCC34043 TaxID=2248760 RepID=UPI000E23EE21|nr:biotin-dependent carboxyltransferase family protein [Tropicimonas sp. IMCC34043]
MSRALILRRGGPGVTVQDLGRVGFLASGLSRGGAADVAALAEGAALLGQSPELAALEMTGSAVEIETEGAVWVALTGAPMAATADGERLAWSACHLLGPGAWLRLTPSGRGHYGYLSAAGGIDLPQVVGGRGAHLAAGLLGPVEPGSILPLGADPLPGRTARRLVPAERFSGGTIRLLAGPQTALFSDAEIARFCATDFKRTAWGNRQGVRLHHDGEGFAPLDGRSLLSETVVPGDVQIAGDGVPYVLGCECQTIGGYPRVGTVLPQDLPRVMQATTGAPLRFAFVTPQAARADYRTPAQLAREVAARAEPLIRDPRDIPDLLAYQLVGGAVTGEDLPWEQTGEDGP